MKYFKDDCHHYKVLNKSTVITVTNLKRFCASIGYENYSDTKHFVIRYIDKKTIKPCTEAEYQTAFNKALKTINNLKN